MEWGEFVLSSIFKNSHGKRLTKQNRKAGNLPLLTASETMQGVSEFISNNNMKIFKNFISIDMFGHCFYHNYQCCGDDNIYFFENHKLNDFIKLFIASCTDKSCVNFSYGKQFRQGNADRQKIMLPITQNGEPDYAFMENFIKERMYHKLKQYNDYLDKQIAQFAFSGSLKEKQWGEFRIEDLFQIKSGKRLTKQDMLTGEMPFIGSSAINNGITNFVSNKNSSLDKNVLGVNYNGSVVENFYHPYECLFSDDVKRFHLKNHTNNKLVLLFLKMVILQQKNKFMYAYKFNEQRMNRQTIKLPITENGEPDYAFMENYTRNLMLKKYKKYAQLRLQEYA